MRPGLRFVIRPAPQTILLGGSPGRGSWPDSQARVSCEGWPLLEVETMITVENAKCNAAIGCIETHLERVGDVFRSRGEALDAAETQLRKTEALDARQIAQALARYGR